MFIFILFIVIGDLYVSPDAFAPHNKASGKLSLSNKTQQQQLNT
ncbi:hypothetical protein AALB_1142 [Agarivorans albus MKT 106]|uniref:Uncharacterized protein n=1 Tax=Agarivorans albus MKT 106 TaxID=1331007 RepID=R9PI92_AGAAL|nr:hypothetical protein AALB_1142 [Agarivorans albus MKT 106]